MMLKNVVEKSLDLKKGNSSNGSLTSCSLEVPEGSSGLGGSGEGCQGCRGQAEGKGAGPSPRTCQELAGTQAVGLRDHPGRDPLQQITESWK